MSRRLLRNVLATVLASRALIFFLIVVGSQIAFLGKDYGNTIWRTQVDLSTERLRPELTRMVMTGDAWYYRQIAAQGYEPPGGGPRNTWAFFPLYPLAVGLIPGDYAMAAMLVSNLAFVAAMLLVAAAGRRLGASEEEVERAVFFMAFFPTSYFFSMPMTESLFLCVSAAAFYLAARGKWWAAGLFGAAAAATRLVGVLLLPALFFMPAKNDRRQKAWLLLIPAATGAFMLYLHRHTGDALAFVHAQTLWNRGTWDLSLMASKPWNFVILNAAAALFLIVAAVDLARRRQWAFAIYVAAAVAIPLGTGSVQSVSRYALTIFPAFLWLGAKTASRPVERLVSATFIILLGWMIAMFVLRVDFALA